MARTRKMQIWIFVHKWSSLICTAFLLLICLTGLPLVFSDEIRDWQTPPYAQLPAGTPNASLDTLVTTARARYPREVVTSIYVDDDEPQVYVWMAPSFKAAKEDPRSQRFIRFDARTAAVLEQSKPLGQRPLRFMDWMLRLHMDLFADLAGELFLAVMALLFVAAVVSGVVLYGPFMKKLDFGTVRADRSRRLKWLDLHNLLGIVTLAWAFVRGGHRADERVVHAAFRTVAAHRRSGHAGAMARQAGPCRPGTGLAPGGAGNGAARRAWNHLHQPCFSGR